MNLKNDIIRASVLCAGATCFPAGIIMLLFGISEWRMHPIECGIQLPYLENIGHELTGKLLVSTGTAIMLLGILSFILSRRWCRR